MSNLTDYAENKIADKFRGQGLTLPSIWYAAFGTAASDSSFTEITGVGLNRFGITRSLANFAGTQSAGSTLASTGTSHTTSNNTAWAFGTPTGGATATHIGLFDASTAGNCWVWLRLDTAVSIVNGVAVTLAIGTFQVVWGTAGGMSDYLSNKLIDEFFRAQAFTWPATTYEALYTATPSNAGGGTEVAAAEYVRPGIASSLAAWSGTQAAASTTASSGTGGRISNNAVMTHVAPTTSWGTVLATGLRDALTSGNLLWWKAVTPRTISADDPAQTHAVDTHSITVA